jgi:6-pyruvoyltetrahydropterin/6-carboxytetrahydropterin synthase
MVELSRTIRFSIPFDHNTLSFDIEDRHNTFAGWPGGSSLAAHYALEVRCRGEIDRTTGYLMNISVIDEAVREKAIPRIARAIRDDPAVPPARLLREIVADLDEPLPGATTAITWHLTPFYALMLETKSMERVILRQQFSFAAAHRLHCPELSAAENQTIFGKCNNRNGHGHNYRLEVAASVPLESGPPEGATGGVARALDLVSLERIVDQHVVQRFDHTHLNLDTPEFEHLIPSVEHITRVCHDLLLEPLAAAAARLAWVTVWETDKTSCTYPADRRPA